MRRQHAETAPTPAALLTERRLWWMFVILVIILSGILFLRDVPALLYFDESRLIMRSLAWFDTGRAFVPSVPYSNEVTVTNSIFLWLQGGWLRLVGFEGANLWYGARLYWWLLLMSAVPVISLTAKKLWGDNAGLFAALLAGLFPMAHNYVRIDGAAAWALAFAIFAFVSAYQHGSNASSRKWYVLAGLFTAMTVEGHPLISLRNILLIGGFMLGWQMRIILRARRWLWHAPTWYFALGGLLYTLAYIPLHYSLWGIPLDQIVPLLIQKYQSEANSFEPTPFWYTFVTENLRLLLLYPLEIFGVLATFIYLSHRALRRRLSQSELYIVLCLAYLVLALLFAYIVHPRFPLFYWYHTLPLVILMTSGVLAGWLGSIMRRRSWGWAHRVTLVMVAILCATQFFRAQQANLRISEAEIAAGFQIAQLLPDQAMTVTGWQTYFYGLQRYDFVYEAAFNRIQANIGSIAEDWRLTYPQMPPSIVVYTPTRSGSRVPLYIAQNDMRLIGCIVMPTQWQASVGAQAIEVYALPALGLRSNTIFCNNHPQIPED